MTPRKQISLVDDDENEHTVSTVDRDNDQHNIDKELSSSSSSSSSDDSSDDDSSSSDSSSSSDDDSSSDEESDDSSSDSDSESSSSDDSALCERIARTKQRARKSTGGMASRKRSWKNNSSSSDESSPEEEHVRGPIVGETQWIPDEIMYNIFSFLDSRTIKNNRLVCKNWFRLVFEEGGAFWMEKLKQLVNIESKKRPPRYHYLYRSRAETEQQVAEACERYFPPMEGCCMLERGKSKCSLCDTRGYMAHSQRLLPFCVTCLREKLISLPMLRNTYGVPETVLKSLVLVHQHPKHKDVLKTEVVYMLGDGNYQKGLDKLVEYKRAVGTSSQTQYNTFLENRTRWLRLLTTYLLSNGYLEEDIGMIVDHHQNDYLTSDYQLVECGLQMIFPSIDAKEWTDLQILGIASSVSYGLDKAYLKYPHLVIHAFFISSAWTYKRTCINKFEEVVNRKSTPSELNILYRKYCEVIDVSWGRTLDSIGGNVSRDVQQLIQETLKWQQLRTCVQQRSNGKYSLDDELPKMTRDVLKSFLETRDTEGSAQRLIEIMDREYEFKMLIEQLGYDYEGVTVPEGVQGFIKKGTPTGQIHTVSRVYDVLSAVNYTVQFIQKVSHKVHGKYDVASSVVLSAFATEPSAIIKEAMAKEVFSNPSVRGLRKIFWRDFNKGRSFMIKRYTGKRAYDQVEHILREEEEKPNLEQISTTTRQPTVQRVSSRKRQKFSSYS